MNFNRSIQPVDIILTGITTSGHSGQRSNGNERVLHNPQSSRTGVLTPEAVYCHIQDNSFRGVLISAGDTVGIL